MLRKRYTYQDVKNIVEEVGYELISKEKEVVNDKGFVLTTTHIKVWCKNPNHEPYKVIFNKFKGYNGQKPIKCKQCLADKLRTSLEDVKKIFKQEGYELLSEYKTNNTPLVLKCPNGHITDTMTLSRFKQGSRCRECGIINTHNKQRHTYKYVKEYIESFNYKLLSKEYINARKSIIVQCPYGHEPYSVRFDNFKNGYRCPICGNISSGEKQKHSYEYIKEYVENKGYNLLSKTYEESRKKIKLLCPNNHEWNVTFDNFQQGNRCPYCNESKGERKIMNWLERNNIKYIYNQGYFKDLLTENNKPLRPDFIIEDKKIWIEYDGEQHCQYGCFGNNLLDLMNIQYRDKIKNNYAKENQWRLIRISYWDYDNIEKILKELFK